MEHAIDQLQAAMYQMHANLHFVLALMSILWVIQIVNWALGYRLNILGIHPRRILGIIGIPCAPFLHGNFTHLLFNSIPLFVLGSFILLAGKHTLFCVSTFIIVISGAATWLLGRKAIHIGASGLVMGYFGFLLVNAYHHPTILTIVLGAVCLYYFGALLLDLFPRDAAVSWEGHLFGFAAGVAASYLCPTIMQRGMLGF